MAASSTSALSAENILQLMSQSLPQKESEQSLPLVKDAYAAIALSCHTFMIAVGFRLVGLGEDHRIGERLLPINMFC